MNRDPFRVTDLRSGQDITIDAPLSRRADEFLRDVHSSGTSSKTTNGRRIECRAHDADPMLADFRDSDGRVRDIWMYPQWRYDRWVLCHYPFERTGRRFADHLTSAPETEEHKFLKEAWQIALDDGGATVVTEHADSNRARRYDVFATTRDGRSFAIEGDHTTRDYRTAKTKQDKDDEAGVTATVFCADRGVPQYRDRVATTELGELSIMERTFHPRFWAITQGPRIVRFHRCFYGSPWNTCPESPKGRKATFCGREHPHLTAWSDRGPLSVADVGERLAEGDMVVVRPGLQKVARCLVDARDGEAVNQYLAERDVEPVDVVVPRSGGHDRLITADQLAKRSTATSTQGAESTPTVVSSRTAGPVRLQHDCVQCGRPCVRYRGFCEACTSAHAANRLEAAERVASLPADPDKPWRATLRASAQLSAELMKENRDGL